jgi:hypothetical protein
LDWIELTYKKFGGKYLRQRRWFLVFLTPES